VDVAAAVIFALVPASDLPEVVVVAIIGGPPGELSQSDTPAEWFAILGSRGHVDLYLEAIGPGFDAADGDAEAIELRRDRRQCDRALGPVLAPLTAKQRAPWLRNPPSWAPAGRHAHVIRQGLQYCAHFIDYRIVRFQGAGRE
jgi:hypothetical protein